MHSHGMNAMTSAQTADIEPLNRSEDEWRAELDADRFHVLREAGTERSGSSTLLDVEAAGTFVCAGCGLALFDSRCKFHSGTGWPSFWDYIEGHLAFTTDYKLMMARREYHCARCGGHQGHVFEDGPEPTGLRYCNNGLSLRFVPADDMSG